MFEAYKKELDMMRFQAKSILRSGVKSLKTLQNAHKMMFQAILGTFIFDIKINPLTLNLLLSSSFICKPPT